MRRLRHGRSLWLDQSVPKRTYPTRDLAKTIRAPKMDVGLRTCESVYFTLDPRKVAGLRKELTARKRAGNGMTASFLAAKTLVDLYQGRDKGRKVRRISNLFAFARRRR